MRNEIHISRNEVVLMPEKEKKEKVVSCVFLKSHGVINPTEIGVKNNK